MTFVSAFKNYIVSFLRCAIINFSQRQVAFLCLEIPLKFFYFDKIFVLLVCLFWWFYKHLIVQTVKMINFSSLIPLTLFLCLLTNLIKILTADFNSKLKSFYKTSFKFLKGCCHRKWCVFWLIVPYVFSGRDEDGRDEVGHSFEDVTNLLLLNGLRKRLLDLKLKKLTCYNTIQILDLKNTTIIDMKIRLTKLTWSADIIYLD